MKRLVDLEEIYTRDVDSRQLNWEEPTLWFRYVPMYVS